jgi:hypothetical protein
MTHRILRWLDRRRPVYNYPPMTPWAALLTCLTMAGWRVWAEGRRRGG